MKLKVMTYNLLYASHERAGDELIHRPERAAAAREVVRAEAPDVIGFTEAAYGGAAGRLLRPDHAELSGLPHVAAAAYPGEWGNCLASRFPITRAERVPCGRSGGRSDGSTEVSALRATIDFGGRPLHIDVVHPSPRISEAERVEALAPLIDAAPRPYILMGDFNALSDEDPYDLGELTRQLTGHVPDPAALAARMLDRRLIAAVRARGLHDAMLPSARAPTIPTRLARPHATQGAALRLDYVFTSPDIVVERAAVIASDAADRASDHYPVVVEAWL